MLTALNQRNEKCIAWEATKEEKPFICPQCKYEVILKKGIKKIHHFAHKASTTCSIGKGESQKHYEIKKAIYEALLKEPNCSKCELERYLDGVRPDISLKIDNNYVAIEIQNSTIDIKLIKQRIERYNKLNIYLIWILPNNTPTLVLPDSKDDTQKKQLCKPKEWEKYLHKLYFSRLYYWQEDAIVKAYHFQPYKYQTSSGNWIEDNPNLDELEGTHWYNENYDDAFYGGYEKTSKTKKEFIVAKENSQEIRLNLAKDFKESKVPEKIFNKELIPERQLWRDKLSKWW